MSSIYRSKKPMWFNFLWNLLGLVQGLAGLILTPFKINIDYHFKLIVWYTRKFELKK